MRVLILGGDGYLGWPTAMYFAARGHEVWTVDNYLRRNLALENDVEPLYATPSLPERARIFEAVSDKKIEVKIGDCTDAKFLNDVFRDFVPEAVVHYAEQPSAPFSMIDQSAATLTLTNNLQSTLNIAWAVHQYAPNCHIIKLGTMGVYGTPNIDIEEGWIEIEHKGRKGKFLFPRAAGSLYHTTKVQDTDLLWFYVRMWGLRVTDLMQGPVYGLSTDETDSDPRLGTCFAYDEIFGTALNRFVVQAVAGYPLTVYGKGGQTRGYLNIRDTLACVELAVKNPPKAHELEIYNQLTETFSVNDLAERVQRVGNERGHKVEVKQIENPRIEAEEHYYNPTYTALQALGLEPNYLTDDVLSGIFEVIEKYKDQIDEHKIFRGIKWG